MDVVKFKITPKTIKIEVRNTNNYVFDFNKAVEMEKVIREVLSFTMRWSFFFKRKKITSIVKLYFTKSNGIFDARLS
jgi:hypothetical protein